MNRKEFDASIRGAFNILLEIKLSSWDRQLSLKNLDPPDAFRKVAFAGDVDYETVFKAGLRYRAYNFLLEDYSYFQFWHDSKRQPRKLRYAYCPNPYVFHALEELKLDGEGLDCELGIDDRYQQALEESPLTIGRPPIRYDLSLDNHEENTHPVSHFTIGGHVENRWPIARILTPRLFVLFVCKHYYSEKWYALAGGALSVNGFTNKLDQALADEKRASRSLDLGNFTVKERLHPFFE